MATSKKFLVFTVLLSTVFYLATAVPAHAKSKNGNGRQYKSASTAAISGTVIGIHTTEDDTNTIFLHIDTKGNGSGDTWVALFESEYKKHKDVIVVGGYVDMQPGMVMEDYEIKILKRKVKKIVFSKGLDSQP